MNNECPYELKLVMHFDEIFFDSLDSFLTYQGRLGKSNHPQIIQFLNFLYNSMDSIIQEQNNFVELNWIEK